MSRQFSTLAIFIPQLKGSDPGGVGRLLQVFDFVPLLSSWSLTSQASGADVD